MVRLLSEKSNVAWFKLAEFVERKEKERALSIYRLLVHSLNDSAYTAQLEGDLFAAFHDDRAIESYRRAALLYEESDRYLPAALVYERMAALQHTSDEVCDSWRRSFALYQLLGYEAKMIRSACALVCVYGTQGQCTQAQEFLETCALAQPKRAAVHAEFLLSLLIYHGQTLSETSSSDSMIKQVETVLELCHDTDFPITNFLTRLRIISPSLHEHACVYLQTH
jgi:hypothetical protein